MDAIGLVNVGTMSSEMRPIRAGMRTAGFAYTVRLVPTQEQVKACGTVEEYMEELGKWCADAYAFGEGFVEGKGKDRVVVIDMGGYPGGVWGSAIAMSAMANGVVGAVIDGGCRDVHECNLEKAKVWRTRATFNHVYGRLANGGVDIPITCAGVAVRPGDVVCGDDDGVLVIPRGRAEEVLKFARAVLEGDQRDRAGLYKRLGYAPDETLGGAKVE